MFHIILMVLQRMNKRKNEEKKGGVWPEIQDSFLLQGGVGGREKWIAVNEKQQQQREWTTLQHGLLDWRQSREVVEDVLMAHSCALCQHQPPVFWKAEGQVIIMGSSTQYKAKHKPEAHSFLLQKLGQQNQQAPTRSQARTSDRVATSAPRWEHCSLPACTQHLFTALQHGFYWQYFTDCSVDESISCLMENSAWIFLMGGFTTCIIWFPAKAIFDKNITVS